MPGFKCWIVKIFCSSLRHTSSSLGVWARLIWVGMFFFNIARPQNWHVAISREAAILWFTGHWPTFSLDDADDAEDADADIGSGLTWWPFERSYRFSLKKLLTNNRAVWSCNEFLDVVEVEIVFFVLIGILEVKVRFFSFPFAVTGERRNAGGVSELVISCAKIE